MTYLEQIKSAFKSVQSINLVYAQCCSCQTLIPKKKKVSGNSYPKIIGYYKLCKRQSFWSSINLSIYQDFRVVYGLVVFQLFIFFKEYRVTKLKCFPVTHKEPLKIMDCFLSFQDLFYFKNYTYIHIFHTSYFFQKI